ncbi:MAG: carbohydrate kinase family protein, partial [Candidatus Pacebacteria bacterium]|nr:carbohydrate kinase family protein [Candidatus Paceibacterota bacterium]
YEIAKIFQITQLNPTTLFKNNTAIVTTLGKKGVRYQDKHNDYYVPGYPVKKVVDPTGAGDAWRGGFVASLLKGQSLTTALQTGNALASFVVEKHGTVNHQPTTTQLNNRIAKLTQLTKTAN